MNQEEEKQNAKKGKRKETQWSYQTCSNNICESKTETLSFLCEK
jgi:hypothetical protein